MRTNKLQPLKLAECHNIKAYGHKGRIHAFYTKSKLEHPTCPKCFSHKTVILDATV